MEVQEARSQTRIMLKGCSRWVGRAVAAEFPSVLRFAILKSKYRRALACEMLHAEALRAKQEVSTSMLSILNHAARESTHRWNAFHRHTRAANARQGALRMTPAAGCVPRALAIRGAKGARSASKTAHAMQATRPCKIMRCGLLLLRRRRLLLLLLLHPDWSAPWRDPSTVSQHR